jgi:3-oxoacyl-[acyl-carrier protein] reductase
MSLDGQVALITGAGRGIGRAIALGLSAAGAKVVLAARGADALERVAEEIGGRGGEALAVPTDVADEAAVRALAGAAVEKFGSVEVLVNNAGSSYVSNLVMSKADRWRGGFDTNVFGAYLCTRAVLRTMIRARRGTIVNISSVSGLVGAAYNSSYSAAKAALNGLTKSTAREVAGFGITANSICPWHVDTELAQETMGARGAMFGKTADEYLAGLAAESPQKRLITPEEIAALTLFLCSPGARGITGQTINVSGGAIMT